MKRGIAECRFRRLRSTIVQVNIVFPSKTHATVNLDATIADRTAASLAYILAMDTAVAASGEFSSSAHPA